MHRASETAAISVNGQSESKRMARVHFGVAGSCTFLAVSRPAARGTWLFRSMFSESGAVSCDVWLWVRDVPPRVPKFFDSCPVPCPVRMRIQEQNRTQTMT
jgi:hypothetical protein